jgi:Flp pilus assembly pilin Flp
LKCRPKKIIRLPTKKQPSYRNKVLRYEKAAKSAYLHLPFKNGRLKILGRFFSLLCADEQGQGLVEYSLLLALAVVVVILALTTLGGKNKNTYNGITNSLPS